MIGHVIGFLSPNLSHLFLISKLRISHSLKSKQLTCKHACHVIEAVLHIVKIKQVLMIATRPPPRDLVFSSRGLLQ